MSFVTIAYADHLHYVEMTWCEQFPYTDYSIVWEPSHRQSWKIKYGVAVQLVGARYGWSDLRKHQKYNSLG